MLNNGITKEYVLQITRPDKLSFANDLKVDGNNLIFEENNITISNALKKITTNGSVIITKANGSSTKSSDIIGTGFKINIKLSNKTSSYYTIIPGDTTGDGKISVADVSKLFQYVR